MATRSRLSRRTLLKGGLAVGTGLVIGFRLPLLDRLLADAQGAGVFAPNQWLRIDRDGIVTIINSVPEMGQGSMTTMPMIVADELDADWERVRVESAPTDPSLYANPVTRQQSYGGSRGVRDHLEPLRKAGAAARQMLREAAAQEWGVPLDEVTTEPGVVVHVPTGRRLLYGQLVDKAQALPVPQNPPLKTKDQFRYIGKARARVDVPQKVNGQAVYGIDVKVPGMLVASIEKCPVVAGGKVRSFDATAAKAIPGVKHVVQVTSGVAVVADNFWTALQGRKVLKVEWDEGPLGQLSSAGIAREHATAAGQPGLVARNDGDALAILAAGGKTLDAVYQLPYLEHACMEPMNATAHVTADACTVWAPTQNPGGSREVAARLTGLPGDRVTVNTTFLGGGFGRRGQTDYVVDAVEVSKAIGGGPVKVLWSREDDLTHGFYRPNTHNVFRAALDAQGKPTAWFTRAVGAGLLRQRGTVAAGQVDGTSMAGLRDLPYDIPNVRIEWVDRDVGVPIGFWRSVGSSQNAFIVETFVDELAHLAGQDPYEYRRALLGKSPRHKAVLELAATQANWGAPLPAGQGRGIAVCFSYASYSAHVAEVSVADDGAVRVHRLVCAIDCGIAVNPDQVKAQMEGGAIYALTATLYGQITLDGGRVQQTNFHTYPMMRIAETPVTEVHILESGQPPGGLGEPGVPTVAPAICNAIFAATGKRIRSLPIQREELKRA
jgi:isoquinoline 1-oxidoreductase subunit beta